MRNPLLGMPALRRREPLTVDQLIERHRPGFEATVRHSCSLERSAADPFHYADDAVENCFAGWVLANLRLREVGRVDQRGSWPRLELNDAGRVLPAGTPVYHIKSEGT